jgi:hypothetical protein
VSERDKISFSELDRRRREKKSNGRQKQPRGEQAQRRSRATAARYRDRIDKELFGNREDAPRLRLEQRLRDAQGSPDFGRTFREYLKGYGMPSDMGLLLMLLDLDAERDVLQVLEALNSAVESAPLEQRNLLRSRLRNLEMSTSSDVLADAATDLLARL